MWGRIAAVWGLGGVVVLLGTAVVRLALIAVDAFQYPFDGWQWSLLITHTAFMAHAEGYKGFQKSYAPRVVARARYLVDEPTPLRIALAPLFCMGYFHTTRRRLLSTYLLTAGIIVLIVIYHDLPQPWRGILDVGVVVGLTWGMVSLVAFGARAFGRSDFDFSPELPQARCTADN
jgi:hypothetical protein